MILHFKGYGLMVPFIFLGCFVVAEMVDLLILVRSGNEVWVLGAALASAGAICWFLGRWLKRRGSLLEDLRKSRQVVPDYCLRSFFWIKMEWWGPIFVVIGLLLLIPGPPEVSGEHPIPVSQQTSKSQGDKFKLQSPASELGNTTNQSQPVGPATNQTAGPAGSSR